MTGGMPHSYHTEVPADRAASCLGQSPGQACPCSLAPVSLCVRRVAFLALLGLNLKATDGENGDTPPRLIISLLSIMNHQGCVC